MGHKARQAGPPHHPKEQRSRGSCWQGHRPHSRGFGRAGLAAASWGLGGRGRLEWPLSTGGGGAESQGHLGNGASGLGASEHGGGRAAETAALAGG